MKNIKKILSMLLVLCLLFSCLYGCGSQKTETTSSETETVTETEETTESETETESESETETESESEEEDPVITQLRETYPNLFIVTVASLNVREEPSVTGALIGGISENSGGNLVEDTMTGWFHISSGTLDGYVSRQYVLTGDEAYARAAEYAEERVKVTDEIVNIRAAASTDGEILGAAYAGAVFNYIGDEGDFYEIEYGQNGTGYIHSDVCEKGLYLTEAVAIERTEAKETEASESGETESESTSDEQTTTAAPVSVQENVSGIPARITQGTNGYSVCIDAGHQQSGISETEPNGPGSSVMKAKLTSGTAGCATGVAEYIVNLQVALKLETELINRGYTVSMIRTTNDCPYSNRERALAANQSGADCFIRIHCNSLNDSSVTGIINYAPSSSNPYMSADLIASSQRFATLLANHMSAATGATNRGIINGDDMTGINWCTCPVSLVEMGFMSNPDEDRKLNDSSYQDLLVKGMADGIDEFFGISR